MSEVAIKVEGVSKYYKLYNSPKDRLKEALNPFGKVYHKDFYALKNINLVINKGEILGVVGKNGCGKSTLLKLITGVLVPNSGGISIDGRVSALLELGSGFNPEFTGMQNIYFYGTILGFSRQEMDGMVEDIISFADIGEFIYQPLKTYSSGMKARLGFSVAVSINPDILILDEVLAVGDVFFQRKCFKKMQQLLNDGKTVLFVSHNFHSIVQFCTRAIFLHDKNIILDGSPKEVTNHYKKLSLLPDQKDAEIDSIKYKQEVLNNYKKHPEDLVDIKRSNTEVINQISIMEFDVKLLDTDGCLVNQLHTGDIYRLEFKFILPKMISDITFGISINTITGLILSCSRDKLNEKKEVFNELDSGEVEVSFYLKFRCVFLPAKYFVKVDLRRGDSELLYEESDILMFEVASSRCKHGQVKACIVDIEQEIMEVT